MLTKIVFSLLISGLALPYFTQAQEVYRWHSRNGTPIYSDTPRGLKPASSNAVNIRSTSSALPKTAPTSTTPTAHTESSLVERQAELTQQITQENRRIAEQNRQIDAENKAQQAANCKTARLNRQLAESARTSHRGEMIAKYDGDIDRFCQ